MLHSLRLFHQLFLLVLFTCSVSVLAFPHGRRASNVVARQDSAFSAQTVTMTQTQNTPQGTVISVCTMVFTPTSDGQVQEISQCVVTTPGDNGSASTSVFTSDVPSATAAAGGPAISVNPVSSVSNPSPPTSSPTAAPNNSPESSSGAAIGGFTTTSVPAASAAAALQSAENSAASASSTPFVIPGKKLQVLPIGLGVFAGISVIALIVVALVTYERTKYRRAFRQRKLAEAAAPIGYGGTQIAPERF